MIASVWVVFSLAAAVVIGFLARPIFPGLDSGESEKVFIKLTELLFNPWIAGVLLAAILAAIMSTIDSQLLVSSSALTDPYTRSSTSPVIPPVHSLAAREVAYFKFFYA